MPVRTAEKIESAIAKFAEIIIRIETNDVSDRKQERLNHMKGMLTALMWANGTEAPVVERILNGAEVKGSTPPPMIHKAARSLADACSVDPWFGGVGIGKTTVAPHVECIVLFTTNGSAIPHKYANEGWAGFIVRVQKKHAVAVDSSRD